MEEITALFSICLLTGVGWVAAKLYFRKIISDENCIYFAPALGAALCGIVAYIAVHFYQPWVIGAFCVAVAVIAVVFRKRLHTTVWRHDGSSARRPAGSNVPWATGEGSGESLISRGGALDPPDEWRLFRFTLLTFLALYGMQIALFALFSRVYPGPHEVWTLFNLTGTPPPDQMFAWHQGMFAEQHRHYPQDAFYIDMDLYDRPHLGGYVTLFFFKLFRLPLTEDHFTYPADGLHFYHCLWWLLNNLYLAGIAPLFRKLFGYRGGILAVATTALGGFFFICTAGGWMKFAGAYPLLLAFLLYLENRGPVLQAGLCAMSYYIHGSVLPFLAGFGVLQVLNLRYPLLGRRLTRRNVGLFAIVGIALVGAWFVVVRWVGSKQPLLYYYLYDAGLTEAQTRPVPEIAKAFYDKHTWANLALLPALNLFRSWVPVELWQSLKAWLTGATPFTLSGVGNVLFASQRFCVECALGLIAAPLVFMGLFKTLAKEHAGKVGFCLYLVPTVIVAIGYRIDWAFSLHILVLYHALALFLWIAVLAPRSGRFVAVWLGAVAIEGMVCVLFAEVRFLPANGLNLGRIGGGQWLWFIAYLIQAGLILALALWETKSYGAEPTDKSGAIASPQVLLAAGVKLLSGAAVIAAVIGIYSIYCLRYYPR